MTSLPSCWDVTVSGVFYLYRITIPGDLRESSLATEQIATSGVDLIFVSYTIPSTQISSRFLSRCSLIVSARIKYLWDLFILVYVSERGSYKGKAARP